MATQIEYIDVIDKSGQVVRSVSKEEIYDKKLSHAIVHVLFFDSEGKMACQIRSKNKSYCPGYISTSVGGHICAGETPEQAGIREMIEEIGKSADLKHLLSAWYEGEEKIKKILHVYKAKIEPPFELNKDEVEKIEYYSVDELKKLPKNKIHPELKFLLKFIEKKP